MSILKIEEKELEKLLTDIFFSSSYLMKWNVKFIKPNRGLSMELTQNPWRWKALMSLFYWEAINFNFSNPDAGKIEEWMKKSSWELSTQFMWIIKQHVLESNQSKNA